MNYLDKLGFKNIDHKSIQPEIVKSGCYDDVQLDFQGYSVEINGTATIQRS